MGEELPHHPEEEHASAAPGHCAKPVGQHQVSMRRGRELVGEHVMHRHTGQGSGERCSRRREFCFHIQKRSFKAMSHMTSAMRVSSMRQAMGLSKTGRSLVAP